MITSATLASEHRSAAGDPPLADHELVELALLLPRWQVEALAAAARGRGLTAGQILRRLVSGYCATLAAPDR